MPDLFDMLDRAGLTRGNHESDLYAANTPEAREIIKTHGSAPERANVKTFVCAITGDPLLELPFCFSPFWERKAGPMIKHKFKVGDKVVFTNDFGVCWGVKTITELGERSGEPTYQREGTDTPWFMTNERNFTLANGADLIAHETGNDAYFQEVHGFTPTAEQLGGCY